MRRLWAAVVVLCIACGGAPKRSGTGSPNSLSGRRIRDVSVSGNTQYRDRTIVAKLAHRPRTGLPLFRKYTYYDPFALRVDVQRIRAFYRERGYFLARADASVRAVRGDQVDVSFEVVEGPPTRLVSVNVRGAPDELRARVDEIVADSDVRVSERLVHPSYLELKDAIVQALVRRGYAHASVEGSIQVDIKRSEAAIDLVVDPGPLVRFGNVAVSGNDRIPTDVILRRLAWEPGDRFDPERIRLTRRRLTELGVFSTIRIEYSKIGRPRSVETEIVVTEAKRHEVKLGGGFGADRERYEVRARAGYAIKSWLHPLVHLRTDGRLGYAFLRGQTKNAVIGEGAASVERHDLFVARMRGSLAATLERNAFEAYTTFGPGARVALERSFGDEDRLHISLGWQVRYLDLDANPSIENALDLRGIHRVAFYEQSISYDGRDDRFVPRRGVFLDLRVEEGGAFAGGAFEYLRVTPDARLYLPLGPLTVATRVRVGWLDSLDDEQTPVTRRYFAGGSSSHRGFNFRELSPQEFDFTTREFVSVGGDAMLESSAELRFGLPWDSFRGVLFADGGDATETFGEIDPGNLHWAAGAGLRLDTVVGPARFDIAYRLNRTARSGLDRWSFHFSLGEAF